MPVIRCGGCGFEGKVSPQFAGKRVRCPRCKTPVSVPTFEPADPPPAADEEEPEAPRRSRLGALKDRLAIALARSNRAKREAITARRIGSWTASAWVDVRIWVLPLVIVAATLTALANRDAPPGTWLIGNVGILIAVVGGFCWIHPLRRILKRFFWPTAIGVALLAATLNHRTATYTKRWSNAEGVDFVETYHRGAEAAFHRRVDKFSAEEWWAGNGPLSESGKLHGQWTFHEFIPAQSSKTQWYWYGEEITEGEWHIRSK